MGREQSATLTEIFKSYRRRDWMNLYLADDSVLTLSRGAVQRNAVTYDNWIASIEDLTTTIDAAVDRITVNCQNVNSLLGFNVASNLRLLDYAIAEYGKIYQSTRNPAQIVDLDTFRGVLANAEVSETRIGFEIIVDYESLGSIVAARGLSPRCWNSYKNGIECTSTSSLPSCPKTRPACKERGKEYEFAGSEFFEEPESEVPSGGGNNGGGIQPCFTGETLIATPNGAIRFDEMKARFDAGIKSVHSFNPETGETIVDEIEEVFEHPVSNYFTFTFEHKTINVTKEHPFLVRFSASYREAFKAADEMRRGFDSVKVFDGRDWRESALLKIKQNSDVSAIVYNLRVKRNHTYFADDCAVHNSKYNPGGGEIPQYPQY